MRKKRAVIVSALGAFFFFGLLILDFEGPFVYVRVQNLYFDAVARAARTTPMNERLVFLAIDVDSVYLDDEIDLQQMYRFGTEHLKEARALRLMTQHWPWPREVYALILERLVEAGAKVVMFDLTFPTPTDGDRPFQLALDKYRDRVVIGSNFVDPSWNGLTKVGTSLTRPPESLISQTTPMDDRIGYTNFWPEKDDVTRRAQYRVTFEQVEGRPLQVDSEHFLSLGARALIKAGFASAVPAGLDSHLLRFTAPPQVGFPPHSLFEIFVPDYWKHNYHSGEFFRDKIVIVGAEGNWQHDEHQTPFGRMSGAELHLNAINAALHREFIHELQPRFTIPLVALAGVLGLVFSLWIRSPWLRLATLLVALASSFCLGLFVVNHYAIFVPLVGPSIELSGTVILGIISDFAGERIEKGRFRRTLERYLSRDLVAEMLRRPEFYADSLGGVIKPVAVLFSDIRGYSIVSAHSDAQVLVAQLNEYLSAMVECVFRFGGTLDKFIGDAVMAVWGNARSEGPRQDALNAVRAALAMRQELASLNARWRTRGMPEFDVGIAINHGEVVVGNIGSPQRMEFTVIGDAVNVSWKLQELTKQLGVQLIVGEQVRDLVIEHFDVQSVGVFGLIGLHKTAEVFTICGPVEVKTSADATPVSMV